MALFIEEGDPGIVIPSGFNEGVADGLNQAVAILFTDNDLVDGANAFQDRVKMKDTFFRSSLYGDVLLGGQNNFHKDVSNVPCPLLPILCPVLRCFVVKARRTGTGIFFLSIETFSHEFNAMMITQCSFDFPTVLCVLPTVHYAVFIGASEILPACFHGFLLWPITASFWPLYIRRQEGLTSVMVKSRSSTINPSYVPAIMLFK